MFALSRRGFCRLLTGAVAAATSRSLSAQEQQSANEAETQLPTPRPIQLAWQDCELGMFFHFDIPIYKPGWDWRSWKDLPDPSLYNPQKLNTDQWMEAAKAFGAKYAVLVAKHCSGFLQWQTDLYPYGLKQSPWRGGKGHLVADFVGSCRKYGIKPGIYASVSANGYWEVDNPGLVNRGKGGDDAKQAAYAKMCEQMLSELWGRYGELFHIWFDGGALSPEQGGPDMLPLLAKLQPNANVFQGPAATVRWVGNESGVSGYPCWATVPQRDYSGNGEPDGKLWLPGECDVPIRGQNWFWAAGEDGSVYPLADLMNMYYKSVGRNCNLLLNANPDTDGCIPEADMKRYAEFGNEIRRRFTTPLAETRGEGTQVELKFPAPQRVNHVVIMEDIAYGERVREYAIEALVGGNQWKELCKGASIGHKRIEQFDALEAAAVRLRIDKHVATPRIRSLTAFNVT